MKLPQFQFTLRTIFFATFWMAVCFASVMRLYVGARDLSLSRQDGWLLMLGAVVSPCLAIGVLTRKTLGAAVIGVFVVFFLWLIASDVFFS